MRAAVTRTELILRVGSTAVSLINRQLRLVRVVILPLATLLILDHLLHLKSRRLRQMALRIERRVRRLVQLRVLVVHVHATAAREIAIANDHALQHQTNSSVN